MNKTCWSVVREKDKRVMSQHGTEEKAKDSQWSLENECLIGETFYITDKLHCNTYFDTAPFTFEVCWSSGAYNHYTIRFNGQVQPFGAMFYGSRGDVKSYVVSAVSKLNKAHEAGVTEVDLQRPPHKDYSKDIMRFTAVIGANGLEKIK